MKKANLIKLSASLALPLFVAGCGTVVRENIISSIETGIGATVAENPKTELYEAKVGYIRSQFYSIPTGKIVKNEKAKYATNTVNEVDIRTNRADLTPEVVSGIHVESDARHLFLGMNVSENFAVGKTAVNSRAATAMYIAQATSTTNATAAQKAIKSMGINVVTEAK